MARNRLTFNCIAATIVLLVASAFAQAQATRTWVSGVGDDVNPCSRTAPCKTFAGAISKTFINGEIDCLDPGGFGVVTITKSITLDGTTGSGFGSILASGAAAGVTVNIAISPTSNDPLAVVRLRNLSINGTGASGSVGTRTGLRGIRVLSANAVFVENCVISDFSQEGIDFQPSANSRLFVTDTIVRNNGASGIFVRPSGGSSTASLDNVRIENNLIGFQLAENSKATVSNSVSTHNTNNGFVINAVTASEMNLESCVTSFNGTPLGGAGLRANGGLTIIRISNVTVTHNFNALTTGAGGQILSYGNNRFAGNTNDANPTGPVPAPNPR